ncbi:MAG: hypothetical protein WBI53_04955, partial [Paludibacter sp.]
VIPNKTLAFQMELQLPESELHFRQLGWKRDAGTPIPATSGCRNQRSRPKGVITILVTDNNPDSGN